MTSRTGPGKLAGAILGVAVVLLGLPGRAHAQFGFGGGFGGFGGFGYGGFGIRQVPSPTNYLYSKSLIDASRPVNAPSRDVNANNPNSFINHLRDPGFVDRYSVDRREIPQYRYAARPRAASARWRRRARTFRCPVFTTPRTSSCGRVMRRSTET